MQAERRGSVTRLLHVWGSAHLGVMSFLQSDGGRCDSDGPYYNARSMISIDPGDAYRNGTIEYPTPAVTMIVVLPLW